MRIFDLRAYIVICMICGNLRASKNIFSSLKIQSMFSKKEIREMLARHNGDPLKILYDLGGYYECPKGGDGKRLGPVVGYAGKYDAGGGIEKQWVGDIYANFAIAEQYPVLIHNFAQQFWKKVSSMGDDIDIICGPQMGGIAIAEMVALVGEKRFAIIEKKVTQLATEKLREQSKLVFARHGIMSGENALVMEDVLNNFSTTSLTIDLIEENGGRVTFIGGLLNRSPNIEHFFDHRGRGIPIISLSRRATSEWRQDAPEVIEDMEKGNVILKPKDNWTPLAEVMEKYKRA